MRKIPLGTTDRLITDSCLPPMTWGPHPPHPPAHPQMAIALAAGLPIVAPSALSPVPPVTPETVGFPETVLGHLNPAHP